jgi:hypothetical protein
MRRGRRGRGHDACPRRHTAVNCSSLEDTPTSPAGFRKNNRVGTGVGARRGVMAFWNSMSSARTCFPPNWPVEKDTDGARMMLSLSIATAGAVIRIPPHFTLRPLPRHGLCPHVNSYSLPQSAPHAPVFSTSTTATTMATYPAPSSFKPSKERRSQEVLHSVARERSFRSVHSPPS